MHLLNTELFTPVQHAFDRRFTLIHPTEFPLHTVQGIPTQTGHFQSQDSGPSCLSGASVERVCAFFQRGPQKSALRSGFVYNCVENALCTAAFVSVLPNAEQTLYFVIAFMKLVSSNGSGAKLLQNGSFGIDFITVCLSTVVYMEF